MDQHLPESDITSAVLSLSPPNLHTEAVTASPVEIFVRAGVHITDHPHRDARPMRPSSPSSPHRTRTVPFPLFPFTVFSSLYLLDL